MDKVALNKKISNEVLIKTKKFIGDLLRNGTNTYDPKTSNMNQYIYGKYGSALTADEMAKLSR